MKLAQQTPKPPTGEAFDVVEASISQLRAALETGRVTSEELVRLYLQRIEKYDSSGICLNALVVMNPDAITEARAASIPIPGRILASTPNRDPRSVTGGKGVQTSALAGRKQESHHDDV